MVSNIKKKNPSTSDQRLSYKEPAYQNDEQLLSP